MDLTLFVFKITKLSQIPQTKCWPKAYLQSTKILLVDNRTSFMSAIIVQAPIIISAQEQIHSDWGSD